MASFVRMIENDLPLIDPVSRCHACGGLGTVGRAIRYRDEVEITHAQFCASCWRKAAAALEHQWAADHAAMIEAHRARTDASPPPSARWTFASATWDQTEEFLEVELPEMLRADPPLTAELLRQIADTWRALAPDRVGVMPVSVERFIAEYGSPDPPDVPV